MQLPTRALVLVLGFLSMVGFLTVAPSWAIAAAPGVESVEGDEAAAPSPRSGPSTAKAAKTAKTAASGDTAAAAGETASTAGETASTAGEIAAGSAVDVRRGFFVKGDFGLFATLGGTWTNREDLPSRPISNVEPHLGAVLGYDLMHSPSYTFSLGARFAIAFNGGAGRVSQEEIQAQDRALTRSKSSDYSILETGLELGLALMLTDRFALSFVADAGAGFVDPNPTLVATDPGAGGASFAPLFGFGVGGEYYTLLNDFSVGFQLRFLGVLAPKAGGGSDFIPGLALTFPLKYTF